MYPRYPQPMPDSLPNPQYPGFYLGPNMSQLLTGAGDAEGSGMQEDPPQPSLEDRLTQAMAQINLLRRESNDLCNKLEKEKKRKGVDQGRPLSSAVPRHLCPLHRCMNQYSIPRYPSYDPNYSGERPLGILNEDDTPLSSG